MNRIVDMIIVIELNHETSADSHPYQTVIQSSVNLQYMLHNMIRTSEILGQNCDNLQKSHFHFFPIFFEAQDTLLITCFITCSTSYILYNITKLSYILQSFTRCLVQFIWWIWQLLGCLLVLNPAGIMNLIVVGVASLMMQLPQQVDCCKKWTDGIFSPCLVFNSFVRFLSFFGSGLWAAQWYNPNVPLVRMKKPLYHL